MLGSVTSVERLIQQAGLEAHIFISGIMGLYQLLYL
jgi:hypothetical protein